MGVVLLLLPPSGALSFKSVCSRHTLSSEADAQVSAVPCLNPEFSILSGIQLRQLEVGSGALPQQSVQFLATPVEPTRSVNPDALILWCPQLILPGNLPALLSSTLCSGPCLARFVWRHHNNVVH